MRIFKKNGGFTLVELIVVIAILAILAGVAIPAYSGYVEKANKAADEGLLNTVFTAFATACMQEGYDHNTVIASLDVDASGKLDKSSGKYIIKAQNGAIQIDLATLDTAFSAFYAGNETSAFKTIKNMSLLIKNGKIGAGYMAEYGDYYLYASGAEVEAWKNGALGEKSGQEMVDLVGETTEFMANTGAWAGFRGDIAGSAEFTDAVEDIVGMPYKQYMMARAGDYYPTDPDKNPVYGSLTWEELPPAMKDMYYNTFTQTDAYASIESNLIAMVATRKAEETGKDILTTLQGTNPKETIKSNLTYVNENQEHEKAVTGATQSALAYGLYLSYAQRNNINTDTLTPSGALNKLKEDGFQSYLKTQNAQTDLDALIAAMNIVGQQDNNVLENVAQNGFDSELADAVQNILGSGQ